MKLVVLISGSGSNLQTFIDQCASGALSAEIACVISNKPDAIGIERAKTAKIATKVLNHKAFDTRDEFDYELSAIIDSYEPDLIILAGFMRILTPAFVKKYLGKMMNIHPSLLPKYPGLHTHQRAIDAKDKKAGATVHFVTPELDGGPAIIQAEVIVAPHETAESLAAKVLEKEHAIYPYAANLFVERRLTLRNNKTILDGEALDEHGYIFKT